MGISDVIFSIVNRVWMNHQWHHCIWLITVSRMLSTERR